MGKEATKISIRSAMTLSMLVVASVPLLILIFTFSYNMNRITVRRTHDYAEAIVRQAGASVDTMLAQVSAVNKQLTASAVTSVLFQNYGTKTPPEKLIMVRAIESSLADAKRTSPNISQIYMVSGDHKVFSSNPDVDPKALLDSSWIQETLAIPAATAITPPHYESYHNINANLTGKQTDVLVISLLSRIMRFGRNDTVAVIQTDIYYTAIEEIMAGTRLGDGGLVLIVDGQGNLVYCPDRTYLGRPQESYLEETVMGDRLIAVSQPLTQADWTVVGFLPAQNVLDEMAAITRSGYLVAGVAALFVLLVSTLLSRWITRPIVALSSRMAQVGKGDFSAEEQGSFSRETSYLTHRFNRMVEEIETLIRENRRQEEEKNRAEFVALQNQINPHFLYNTLNSLKWMALMAGNKTIAEAVVALVNMLQFASRDPSAGTTVAGEIQFVRNYVLIQQIRYGEDLTVDWDVSESILPCRALKFILQPIVENAILHGLSEKDYRGTVTVTGREEAGRIRFVVSDDGKGMRLDKGIRFSGVGMENVKKRLQSHYGKQGEIRVESQLGLGTRVTLYWPKELPTGKEEPC